MSEFTLLTELVFCVNMVFKFFFSSSPDFWQLHFSKTKKDSLHHYNYNNEKL